MTGRRSARGCPSEREQASWGHAVRVHVALISISADPELWLLLPCLVVCRRCRIYSPACDIHTTAATRPSAGPTVIVAVAAATIGVRYSQN